MLSLLKSGKDIDNIYFDDNIAKSFGAHDNIEKKIEKTKYRAMFGIITGKGSKLFTKIKFKFSNLTVDCFVNFQISLKILPLQ